MEPTIDAVPIAPPIEPFWRLALRLALDAAAFVVLAALFVAVPLGAVWLASAAARGLEATSASIEGARQAFAGMTFNVQMTSFFAAGAVGYLAVIAAILAVARARRGADWRAYIAWAPFRFEWIYGAVAVAAVVWGAAIGSVIEYLHPEAKQWVTFPKGPVGVVATVALAVFIGPLCEELIFRGWLFTALRSRLGALATIAATAVLFACAHWESTHLYALAVFPIGLMLGYIRQRSGSMRASFAFHGIYNFAGWILAALAGR